MTPEEFMAARWAADATAWPNIAPPDDPRAWEGFLQDYFGGRGFWATEALDDEDHSMSPRESSYLGTGFEFGEATEEFVTFWIRQFASATFRLPKTRVLRILKPGIVVAGNGRGDWVRIDGHLTPADEKWLWDMDQWEGPAFARGDLTSLI